MLKPETRSNLEMLRAAVKRQLDALPAFDWQDRREYDAAIARAADELRALYGATIVERWDGARIRLGGTASTCTHGVAGALQNWLAAVDRRLRER